MSIPELAVAGLVVAVISFAIWKSKRRKSGSGSGSGGSGNDNPPTQQQ